VHHHARVSLDVASPTGLGAAVKVQAALDPYAPNRCDRRLAFFAEPTRLPLGILISI
jgi:hypothetical protein